MANDGTSTPLGTPPGARSPTNKGADGASGSDKEGVIRQRVVRVANWPLLTKMNYTEWSLLMKIKMQARNLWDAIETGDVTLQEDHMELDAITSVVPQEMVASLAVKESVAKAWEAIKSMRIGSDQVHKTRAQCLRREFESIHFNNGESVDGFTCRLTNLVDIDTVTDIHVVIPERFLRNA
uniref:DUF4219 domain-containing protein n=1 Tax=Arundo donax TaxID=35708 RepID=A0A0A9CNQ1_ARUDO